MLTYTLKIIQIYKETDDACTICFKQPGLKKIKYKAGQYITLIVRINGRKYARPYSFSSAPGIDATLNITIKRVPGGVVSNHILDKVNVGDMMEVIEPMGDFILQETLKDINDKHLILWGSGSGITPLMSITKYALKEKDFKHITLVYGNRNFETTIFSEQIKQLEKLYPNNFSTWHFHTKPVIDENNPYVILGRIDAKKILDVMRLEGGFTDTIHYICGPRGLKDSVKTVLKVIGVNVENIFSEDFEVTRDLKEFENIATQNVEIKMNNFTSTIEVTKGKSILEASLDAMLDLPYSCQTGSCLLCKATLLRGSIKTIGIDSLPAEFQADECLLCCSFPLSDDIKVFVKNQLLK
ncbi:MAG: ferredoxin--NADP reductase [Mucilaginibacter sp.]|uniref:ferredoxin--NADP reductase n=1 Tax=Mucilaginibacter sp. TaxID=1882438 RepID=UPI0026224BFF|nr:ferredoxin--NADP reductase [Mucilaginibacter sp.]MDB5002296.1 ferredoxin--NADP reductase [Mucilaginibacter sp.]